MHGTRAGARPSIYADQLRQKQRPEALYGVRERQLPRYVRDAARRREGRMGEHLLTLLERRLDNVVYRLGFAGTRAQARQFVTHGHVLVDGRKVDIPFLSLRPGQEVAIRPAARRPGRPGRARPLRAVPGWLQADVEGVSGTVCASPARNEIPTPVEEQLIVEHLARR